MRAAHLQRCTTRLELALSDSQSDVLTFSPSAPKCGNTANAILPYKRWTVVCTNAKISVYPKHYFYVHNKYCVLAKILSRPLRCVHNIVTTGVAGFEPTMRESKSLALPLGYTPSA